MKKRLVLSFIIGIYLLDIFVATTHFAGKSNNLLLNILLGISQLSSIFAGFYSIRILGLKNPIGKAVMFFALGLFVTCIGSSIFAFYDFTAGNVGFPSLADIFILCGYPLLFLGLLSQLRSTKISIGRSNIFLLSLVSLLLAVVIVYFGIILPFDKAAPFIVNFVQTLYGVADLVLIVVFVFVLLLTFEYKGGKFFYPWFLLFVGVICTLLGDILFAIFTKDYLAQTGIHPFIDLLWSLAYVFYTYGLLNLGVIILEVQNSIMQKIKIEKTDDKERINVTKTI